MGEELCPLRLGNLIPSKNNKRNAQPKCVNISHKQPEIKPTALKCKLQRRELLLPEEGLLLRGEGGANVKSGCIRGLLLWGGDPNAGKCWRFSNPICTSGSGGTCECKHSYRPQFDSSDLCTFSWKYNSQVELWPDQLYLHLPCFLFSSISIRLSLRFSSLTFFCLRRFLFSNSSSSLEEHLYTQQSMKSPWYNCKFTSRKQAKCANLRMCPEFLWTRLAAVGPTHRCWTRTWGADERDSDADDGSPATKHEKSVKAKMVFAMFSAYTATPKLSDLRFLVRWPQWLCAPLSPQLWQWLSQDWPPSCRIHATGSVHSQDAGTSAGSHQLEGETWEGEEQVMRKRLGQHWNLNVREEKKQWPTQPRQTGFLYF